MNTSAVILDGRTFAAVSEPIPAGFHPLPFGYEPRTARFEALYRAAAQSLPN